MAMMLRRRMQKKKLDWNNRSRQLPASSFIQGDGGQLFVSCALKYFIEFLRFSLKPINQYTL
jgi:hypothetical protein